MASNGTSRRPLRAPWRGLATSLLAASAALSLFAVEGRASAQETLGAPTIGTVTAAPVSLTVNWSAPSQTGSSTITAYDIRYILTSATDRTDGNWTLEEAWVAGGSTLRHAVTGLRDSTSYDIQVRAVAASDDGPWSTPATAGTTTDHGGTTSAATPLALGSSAAGRIDLGGDADVFSLVVPAATEIWLYTTGDLDTTGVLTDSSDMDVASNEDGMLPPNPGNFSMRAVLADAGAYYVKVTAAQEGATGAYTLHARAVAAPGSTAAGAATVTPGSVTAARLAAGATHYFRVDLSLATDLWVLAIGETNTAGELLNASQSMVVQNGDSRITGNETSFSLRASVAAGTYYVKVTGASSLTAGPYILYLHSGAVPGDSMATAFPLAVEAPAPGRIDSSNDDDYFRITLDSATHLRLEAHGGSLRLTPTLLDGQGDELPLYYLNDAGWNQIDGKGLSLWALERLPAGTYWIRIKADAGQTGAYLLHPAVDADTVAQDEACMALGMSSTVSDPLYGCQWHLKNTNQFGAGGGFDINVEQAWETTLGEGINVLVVDSGLDYLHPDLRGYEYDSGDPGDDTMGHRDTTGNGVRRPGATHGTLVAGVIAARDNDIGGRGVAPRATIYSFAIGSPLSDATQADAASHLSDVTAVVNNSWRSVSKGVMVNAPPGWDAAAEAGITSGYGGKGVFYVWITHNRHLEGSNANLDGKLNHHSSTVVCAVDYEDVRAAYSELGANLWVCAPADDEPATLPGIATTAPGNSYNMNFGGTSASGPIVSGVAALVRAANTALTWRDVKLILAGSARRNDVSNTGWSRGAIEYGPSSERYWYNREYGFGVVDAGAAVALALAWTPLPAFREISADGAPALAITDAPATGDPTTVSGSVTLGPYVGFVEFVEVALTLTHEHYRDLRFELVSPDGVTSLLLPPQDVPNHGSRREARNATWRLGSARHLGENAAGTWTLRVTDVVNGKAGTIHSWTLTAYGHGDTPGAPGITSATMGANAVTVAWTAPAPDDIGGSAITSYDARRIRSDAMDKSDSNWAVVSGIWSSGDLEAEVGGLDDGVSYDIQVRAVNVGGVGLWSETIKGTTAVAPGAPGIGRVNPRDRGMGLAWTAPTSDGGAPVDSYDARSIRSDATVEEKSVDANWTPYTGIWSSTPGGELRGNIGGLDNGVRYDVQVRAVSPVDPGPWSRTAMGTPAVVNQDPSFPATDAGVREVGENIGVGQNVGAPVAARDPDQGDTLTYSIASDHTPFGIGATTGQLRTKGALDYETAPSYSFTVQVTDMLDSSDDEDPTIDDTIEVTVTVTDVNEPPMIAGDAAITRAENFAGALHIYTATDPDRTVTTFTWSLAGADARDFTIGTSTGALEFTFPPDAERPADANGDNIYSVAVRASDGVATGTFPVTVTVTEIDEPPVITGPKSITVDEGHTGELARYRKSDPEDALTNWAAAGQTAAIGGADAGAFEFDKVRGALSFTAPPDFEQRGSYEVALQANDGTNDAELVITVNITNLEERAAVTFDRERPILNRTLTATLEDGDGVQGAESWAWQRSTSRGGGWGEPIAGAASNVFTPLAADRDHYLRATVEYSDSHGAKTERAITKLPAANIPAGNTAPVLPDSVEPISIPESTRAGSNVGRPVRASDAELDPLSYSLSGSSDFVIDSTRGQIKVADAVVLDFDKGQTSYTLTVGVDDGFEGRDSVTVTVTVTGVNEAPVAGDDVGTTYEDEVMVVSVLGNDLDPENDDLEVIRVTDPQYGAVEVDAGGKTITYTPRANYHGADSFEYTVNDGDLGDQAQVGVTVHPLNDAPAFAAATAERSVSENAQPGTNVGGAITATDVDDDRLSYSIQGAPEFEIDEQTGQITVAASPDAARSPYSVTISARDHDGEEATVAVSITVTAGAPPITVFPSGGGGGGPSGGGPSGRTPSEVDFEWTVERDLEQLDGGNDWPTGLWSDGETLWIVENGEGSDDAVYAYDRNSGERRSELEFTLAEANRAPRGFWSDGETAWVSDSGRDRIFAYRLADGERVEEREFEFPRENRAARGIWSDGRTMWVLDSRADALFAYDLESVELRAEYALNSANSNSHGIWSDGVTVWVSDHGAKRLFAYRLPALPDDEADSGEEDAEDDTRELERVRDEEFPGTVLSRASNNSPRGIWSDGDVMYVADESDDKVYTYNMPDSIDARLASLTLSGVGIGEFSPNHEEYEGAADEGVTETTVTAEALQRGTDVDIGPPDADVEADGYQVALEDLTEITVTVTSADGSRKKTYRVRLGPEEAAGPAPDCLRGDVAVGFSLVVYAGGSVEDLAACAEGRNVTALYALSGGEYVSYILGAPAFVNADFRALFADGVPALTPLTVKSDGPPSADPAPDGGVAQPWAACLQGEIAEGFNLVVYEGGSVDDLVACAEGVGLATLYALDGGEYVSYILGAPEFVNEDFRALFADGVPSVTPLVVKRDGP